MSSNNFSTDPADDDPEADDYSDLDEVDEVDEVDEIDAVAADLAAELAKRGGFPRDTASPSTSPERLAAELAERVGLPGHLGGLGQQDATPVASDPVAGAEDDLTGGQGVADRAGWFPSGRPEPPEHRRPPAAPEPTGAPEGPDGRAPGRAPDPGPAEPAAAPVDRPPSSPPIKRPTLPNPPSAESARAPAPAPSPTGWVEGEADHPIDQVAVRKLGGFNFLSVAQWSALSRDERARLLKGGLVIFLFEGEEVAVRPALVWLQRLARPDLRWPRRPGHPPPGR